MCWSRRGESNTRNPLMGLRLMRPASYHCSTPHRRQLVPRQASCVLVVPGGVKPPCPALFLRRRSRIQEPSCCICRVRQATPHAHRTRGSCVGGSGRPRTCDAPGMSRVLCPSEVRSLGSPPGGPLTRTHDGTGCSPRIRSGASAARCTGRFPRGAGRTCLLVLPGDVGWGGRIRTPGIRIQSAAVYR